MQIKNRARKNKKRKKEWLSSGETERERPYESKKENKMKQAEQSVPLWKDILSLFIKLGILALLFLAMFTFVFGLFRNQDADMYPNIKDGDLVVYYRLDKNYTARDLTVLDCQGSRQVRRVIAVAGDTVDITEDGLLVNGSPQQEPGIYEETKRYAEGMDFPVMLRDEEIFVLGDAREDATDSRVYGIVQADDTLGKVMLVIRRREF